MKNGSSRYINIAHTSVQPKCEPYIDVEGIDQDGNSIKIEFTPQSIMTFTLHHQEDPLMRSIPSIDLEWTEAYLGELNEDSDVEKYSNVFPLMKVTLRLRQYLDYSGIEYEEFNYPQLFLVGRPSYNNKTITWQAADLFYFLNMSHNTVAFWINFDNTYKTNPFKFVSLALRKEARLFFGHALDELFRIEDCFWESEKNVQNDILKMTDITTKEIVSNLCSLYAQWLTWNTNYIDSAIALRELKDVDFENVITSNIVYTPDTVRDTPVVANVDKIQGLSVEYSELRQKQDTKNYTEYPYRTETLVTDDGVDYPCIVVEPESEIIHAHWRQAFRGDFYYQLTFAPNKAYIPEDEEDKDITEYTLTQNKIDVVLSGYGTIYEEKNLVSGTDYTQKDEFAEKKSFLENWFDGTKKTIEFTALPDLRVECGDIITIYTDLWKNGARITYNALVEDVKINYGSGIWQTIICHTINEVSNNG